MLSKTSALFAVFAVTAQLVAAATPPACLLAAVNTQPNPADLKAVCGNSTSVEHTINDICNDNVQPAMSAFMSICKNAGVAVSTVASSSSATSTKSTGTTSTSYSSGAAASATGTIIYTSHYYDASCSCTKTTSLTTTGLAAPTGILTAGTSSGNGTVAGGAKTTGAIGSGSGSTAASGTSSGTAAAQFTGAAGKVELGGLSAGIIAVAGLVLMF